MIRRGVSHRPPLFLSLDEVKRMRTILRFSAAFRWTATLLVLGLVAPARAHAGPEASHGGTLAKTRRHQFEVVFRKDGLSVYPTGPGNTSVDVSKLSGT